LLSSGVDELIHEGPDPRSDEDVEFVLGVTIGDVIDGVFNVGLIVENHRVNGGDNVSDSESCGGVADGDILQEDFTIVAVQET